MWVLLLLPYFSLAADDFDCRLWVKFLDEIATWEKMKDLYRHDKMSVDMIGYRIRFLQEQMSEGKYEWRNKNIGGLDND